MVRRLSIVATLIAIGAGIASADAAIHVQGAGATFPKPLYLKLVANFNEQHPGVVVDYQGIGSGGGVKGMTDRAVDFGASDAPLTEVQFAAMKRKNVMIPIVAGPIAVIYNLQTLGKPLALSGPSLAGIYLGQISTWNDPAIVANNSGVALPKVDILVVRRSDGSGGNFAFTRYLSAVSDEWAKQVHYGTAVKWPLGLAGKGGDGPAAPVKQNDGGIGYVELAYAQKNKIPYARMINASGKAVEPSVAGAESALAGATISTTGEVVIGDPKGDDVYPITLVTYLLVDQEITDAEKAKAVVDFVWYATHDGQAEAKQLNYATLPPAIVKRVETQLRSITTGGKPVLPPA